LNPRINFYDPNVIPSSFREEVYDKARTGKIKVGYIESFTNLPASPPVQRAVRMAKSALEK
jgi:hypothetical protein